jgi:hypothetical protein
LPKNSREKREIVLSTSLSAQNSVWDSAFRLAQNKIIPVRDTIMCRRHISYLPLANISFAERKFHIGTLCRYFIQKGDASLPPRGHKEVF